MVAKATADVLVFKGAKDLVWSCEVPDLLEANREHSGLHTPLVILVHGEDEIPVAVFMEVCGEFFHVFLEVLRVLPQELLLGPLAHHDQYISTHITYQPLTIIPAYKKYPLQPPQPHFLFIDIFQHLTSISNMRGSPISNLRSRADYSPYQSNPHNSSPRTNQNSPSRTANPYSSGEEYWRGRVRQLESELVAVNEELVFQIRRGQKIDDLEEKIELLLAQNTHFVDENENLIQLVSQKNNQIEVWKRKFDSEYSHSNLAEAEKRKVFDHLNIKDQEHQFQIEKLLTEITRLQSQAVESDNLKKLEIHRLKNQYESESIAQIQNLRRSQNGNNQIQELNIRKLKDTIDEKDFQIQNLNRQIRLKNEELKTETAFSKNELKKLEEQKAHQLDLIKTESENVKNNLARQHRKNEDELKNLHQAKVKRLNYEIEEKKHEIEEGNNRLKRTGKEGEAEVARLINDNCVLRNELKDNDNRNKTRLIELTSFYETQFQQERQVNSQRESNLQQHYDSDIASLRAIIAAKEEEITRILDINKELKLNEENRLELIKSNNYELKDKINEVIKHYEREIELNKIKIGQLYEADLQSLRNQMRNSYANHALEIQSLRDQLASTRERLAREVQDRFDQRKDYEIRLQQMHASHDRVQREHKNVISHREKEIEGHTSKASLTHIEHNQLLQNRHINMKQLMGEKRNLENTIANKNKEIETLNLKVVQMMGLHKRDIDKLEEDLTLANSEHNRWLERQQKETEEWQDERKELNGQIEALNKRINDLKKAHQDKETKFNETLEEKGLEIADLKGKIQELHNKIKHLSSKNQVEVENVEKTMLETRTLMNTEKEKLMGTATKEKSLLQDENERVRSELNIQIADLRKENDILLDNYQQSKIREQELKGDVRGLTDTVNKRAKLEESVINIGLSNNYFKNVAEIFKRDLSP